MRDPYLYKDSNVLQNKLNIKVQQELDDAEADYVVFRLKDLILHPIGGEYDLKHLLSIHEYIFQDLYEWAGKCRTISIYKEEDILGGQSIEYSEPENIEEDIKSCLLAMKSKSWQYMDRNNITVEFCDSLARLWRVHPFREGNTRTTVTFCCQFADEIGLNINRSLFEKNAVYVRTSLVAYNAYFKDGNDFSKKQYLQKIVYDALG